MFRFKVKEEPEMGKVCSAVAESKRRKEVGGRCRREEKIYFFFFQSFKVRKGFTCETTLLNTETDL